MAVYVDELMQCRVSARWPYKQACHMKADTLEELHAMAEKIGIQRSWFQEKSSPHYDLTANKRTLAIGHGAIALTWREMVEKTMEWRRKQAQARQDHRCSDGKPKGDQDGNSNPMDVAQTSR